MRVLGHGHADVKFLIANLAKLSVQVGGRHAATMLHRFLVAGVRIPTDSDHRFRRIPISDSD